MPATLFDVSPRGSSAYTPPTFSAIGQGLSQLGAGLGAGIQDRRKRKKEEEAKAALQAAFGIYGEGGRDAVMEGLRSGSLDASMMKELWPMLEADRAQANADRTFGLQERQFNAAEAARQAALDRAETEKARVAELRKLAHSIVNEGGVAAYNQAIADGTVTGELQADILAMDKALKAGDGDPPKLDGITLFDRKTGDTVTLNPNNPEHVAQGERLMAQGWIEGEPPTSERNELTTGSETDAQKDIRELRDLGDNLVRVHESVSPQNQTALGRKGAQVISLVEWLAPGMVPEDARKMSYDYATFDANVTNYQNQMIKLMSGAAVSDQEAQRLIKTFPTSKDSPSVFAAKFNASSAEVESKVRNRLRELGDPDADRFTLPRMDVPQGDGDWKSVLGGVADRAGDSIAGMEAGADAGLAAVTDALGNAGAAQAAPAFEMPDVSSLNTREEIEAVTADLLKNVSVMGPDEAQKALDALKARAAELIAPESPPPSPRGNTAASIRRQARQAQKNANDDYRQSRNWLLGLWN
ncbi:MAG: hypothetical protein F4213_22210 [Boseongicola sp. SB0677_bin_26]|nr:hypothetical protein [Boseongicola sp. SB0677_bin_26]